MRRARAGEAGPLWLAAREQTKGRGRQGRAWQSPRGNLAASLLLIDPAPMALASQLGFVAGVALAETVAELLPAPYRAQIKWPNDLVVDGAKLSGLLLEATHLPDGHLACVIGFGLNVVAHPEGLPYAATSLQALGGCDSAGLVLEHLAAHMSSWLALWQRGENFQAVRLAWMKHAAGLDSTVRVSIGHIERSGYFRGIDTAGQMILETQSGRETIAAGDVFLEAQHVPAWQKNLKRDQVIDGNG